jgi:general secretion pathway protein N
MQLSWSTLGLARAGNAMDVKGRTLLAMNDMGSRMAPVKPLGSYELTMDWSGQQAQLSLRTVRGALLLSGTGSLDKGRFQFAGQAQAANGYEETLGNLLSLLGQRRMVGGKNIIALEFK